MLILQGTLRAATVLGGGTNKKTGEIIPERSVLQVETTDNRGLVKMYDHRPITGWIYRENRPAREHPRSCLGNWPDGEFRL